jgi:hypothetical protein
MGQITGGKVTYGRTLKTGDYENKRVDVELAFTVEEGEDYEAMLQAASEAAVAKAHAMLGLGTVAKSPAAAPKAAPQAETSAPVQPTAEGEKKRPGRPPKAALVPGGTSTLLPQVGSQIDLEEVIPSEKPKADVTKKAAAVELDDLGEPVKEITDELIGKAAMDTNKRIQDPAGIRKVIQAFLPTYDPEQGPPKAAMIPKERRQAFMDKLATLQPGVSL